MPWLYFHHDIYFKAIFASTIDVQLNVIFQYKLSYFRHAGWVGYETGKRRKVPLNPAANAGSPGLSLLADAAAEQILVLRRQGLSAGYPDRADPP